MGVGRPSEPGRLRGAKGVKGVSLSKCSQEGKKKLIAAVLGLVAGSRDKENCLSVKRRGEGEGHSGYGRPVRSLVKTSNQNAP